MNVLIAFTLLIASGAISGVVEHKFGVKDPTIYSMFGCITGGLGAFFIMV